MLPELCQEALMLPESCQEALMLPENPGSDPIIS